MQGQRNGVGGTGWTVTSRIGGVGMLPRVQDYYVGVEHGQKSNKQVSSKSPFYTFPVRALIRSYVLNLLQY
jgi:hypothetical protein